SGILGTAVRQTAQPRDRDAEQSLALPRTEAQAIMNSAAAALAAPGTGMVGWFVAGPSATTLLDGLDATAVLRIIPTRIEGSQAEGVRKETVKTQDGRTKEVAYRVFNQEMRCIFTYRLEAWPEGTLLATRRFAA